MPYLSQLKISNFKSFSKEQVFDFAYPRSTGAKKLIGLTVIVGQNNSGKSSVFDALMKLHGGKRFPRSERHNTKTVEITLIDENQVETSITNLEGGNQIHISSTASFKQTNFDFVRSRRFWSHRFSGQRQWENYDNQSMGKDKQSVDDAFGSILSNINCDSKKKDEFNSILNRLVPDLRKWTIDSDDEAASDFISYETASGHRHSSSLLGDGVISLFRIAASLVRDDDKILIIDEPELSLHPQVLKSLSSVLAQESNKRQIIISTHSPYFIRWEDIENGAKLVRINKNSNDFAEVKCFDYDDQYINKIISLADYQKPQLLDTAAKEIFFSQGSVFVEGQEDVGLLRRSFPDLPFEIFGYGTGGAGNVKLFLELANALGVRAGAIFDGDKKDESKKCTKQFPNCAIYHHSAADIRDKFERDENGREVTDRLLKEGCFTRNGELKATHYKRMYCIMVLLCKFFSNEQAA